MRVDSIFEGMRLLTSGMDREAPVFISTTEIRKLPSRLRISQTAELPPPVFDGYGGGGMPPRSVYRYLDCGDLHNGFARVKLVLDLIGDVKTAVMDTSWHFPASAATSAPPAIRKGLWNSGNSYAQTSSRRFPIGILSSVSRRSSAVIFSMTGSFLPI